MYELLKLLIMLYIYSLVKSVTFLSLCYRFLCFRWIKIIITRNRLWNSRRNLASKTGADVRNTCVQTSANFLFGVTLLVPADTMHQSSTVSLLSPTATEDGFLFCK